MSVETTSEACPHGSTSRSVHELRRYLHAGKAAQRPAPSTGDYVVRALLRYLRKLCRVLPQARAQLPSYPICLERALVGTRSGNQPNGLRIPSARDSPCIMRMCDTHRRLSSRRDESLHLPRGYLGASGTSGRAGPVARPSRRWHPIARAVGRTSARRWTPTSRAVAAREGTTGVRSAAPPSIRSRRTNRRRRFDLHTCSTRCRCSTSN